MKWLLAWSSGGGQGTVPASGVVLNVWHDGMKRTRLNQNTYPLDSLLSGAQARTWAFSSFDAKSRGFFFLLFLCAGLETTDDEGALWTIDRGAWGSSSSTPPTAAALRSPPLAATASHPLPLPLLAP